MNTNRLIPAISGCRLHSRRVTDSWPPLNTSTRRPLMTDRGIQEYREHLSTSSSMNLLYFQDTQSWLFFSSHFVLAWLKIPDMHTKCYDVQNVCLSIFFDTPFQSLTYIVLVYIALIYYFADRLSTFMSIYICVCVCFFPSDCQCICVVSSFLICCYLLILT